MRKLWRVVLIFFAGAVWAQDDSDAAACMAQLIEANAQYAQCRMEVEQTTQTIATIRADTTRYRESSELCRETSERHVKLIERLQDAAERASKVEEECRRSRDHHAKVFRECTSEMQAYKSKVAGDSARKEAELKALTADLTHVKALLTKTSKEVDNLSATLVNSEQQVVLMQREYSTVLAESTQLVKWGNIRQTCNYVWKVTLALHRVIFINLWKSVPTVISSSLVAASSYLMHNVLLKSLSFSPLQNALASALLAGSELQRYLQYMQASYFHHMALTLEKLGGLADSLFMSRLLRQMIRVDPSLESGLSTNKADQLLLFSVVLLSHALALPLLIRSAYTLRRLVYLPLRGAKDAVRCSANSADSADSTTEFPSSSLKGGGPPPTPRPQRNRRSTAETGDASEVELRKENVALPKSSPRPRRGARKR